jgi:hypothetical protein
MDVRGTEVAKQGFRAGRPRRRNAARRQFLATRPAAVAAAVMALLATSAGAAVLPAGPAWSAGNMGPAPGAQLVRYHGYEIQVPASWPVYHLTADPTRCVLFSSHAVYLGTPGPDQRCPAHAVGRTSAVLIQPAGQPGQLPPGTAVLPSSTAALPARASLPAATTAAAAAGHALQIVVSRAGVLVTATYGADPAQARAILAGGRSTTGTTSPQPATTRTTSPQPATGTTSPRAATARTSSPQPATGTTSPRAATGTASPLPASGPAATTPAAPAAAATAAPVASAAGSPGGLVGRRGRGLGFDSCTAPAAQTMSAWRVSPYRVVGTDLGGVNWACGYGSFNGNWIAAVTAQGWQFIPIWVGLQAPCYAHAGVQKIKAPEAYTEGKADAASAAATARSFGYGQGSPIYFDMEGYPRNNASCAKAVLSFLAGWTRRLHTAGYLSGVYSSASSGIADLATKYHVSGYPRPDDIWIADWDGSMGLADPSVPRGDWTGHRRLHQYYGGHDETWGGATLDIDDNSVGGTVASARPTHIRARPFIISQPDAVAASAGQTTKVRLVITAVGRRTAVHWMASAPAGLTIRPSQGTRTVRPHRTATVTVSLTPAATLPAGHYDVPVTATAGTRSLTETFELVSVTNGGTGPVTSSPIVLYAADPASLSTATTAARRLGLPATSVTGTFAQAWTDTVNGQHLVIAIGQAAANALSTDACGWPRPAGTGSATANSYPGRPLRTPPGARIFELGDGATAAVAQRLLHYAVTGTLPGEGAPPAGSVRPTSTCLGTPSVSLPAAGPDLQPGPA